MNTKCQGFSIAFVALVLLASVAFTQQVHAAAPTTTPGTSLTDAQRHALIVQLTAQVQALYAQVAAITGGTSETFSSDLQLGSTGSVVKRLQVWLNAHGYAVAANGPGSSGNETALFGILTYRALIKFQTASGLPATGFFGPLTRAVINSSDLSPLTVSPPPAAVPIAPSLNTTPSQSLIPQPFAPGNGYTPGFGGGGGSPTQTPTPDTTAPTVSVTAPADGATIYGSAVTLSANASDDTAVLGVQFKVDGENVGSEDTSSPYSITWDSTATSSGSKSIVAVAHDTAGNYATSTAIAVTVDNTAPIISSISSDRSSDVTATITWTTNEASDSQIEYGLTNAYGATTTLDASLVTSHSVLLSGLTAGATYHFRIRSIDSPGNLTTSDDQLLLPPRNLFWVGGTDNWDADSTTHWSTSSGGSGGATPPTSIDTVTFDGSSGGGTVTMTANVTVVSITSGAHTGTINTNGKMVIAGSWNGSGTATRGLNISNSTINLTSASGTPWNFTTITGLTFTSTNSTINFTGNGNRGFAFSTLSYGTVNITGTGAVTMSNTAATFVNLNRTGGASKTDSTFLPSFTITGTLTLAGNSQTERLLVTSGNAGSQRTVTSANVALSNVDISNITGAGVASWTGTSIGDAGGNTNITFATPVTRYWVGDSGNWSDVAHWSATSGGASGATMPLPQDTAVFDANSFSASVQTVTLDVPRIGAQNWSAVTNTPTLALTASYNIYGNLDLPTGSGTIGSGAMLMTGNFTGTIANQSGTVTINLHLSQVHLNNHGFPSGITINAPGGTVQLAGHFQANGLFTINSGTFDANDFDLQVTFFRSTGTATRSLLMGSGTWLSTSNGTLWDTTATGMTLTAETSTIKFYSASAPARTFNGAGLTYYNFIDTNHDGLDNSGAPLIITGANTFNEFRVDSQSVARSVTFPAGATNTFSSFIADGRSGALLTLNSSASGSPATLSDASGTNSTTYLSIKDITATGGATWTATNSVNVSGNTGWAISP